MVSVDIEAVKEIIASESYNNLVSDLKMETGLSVVSEYQDVFARLDCAMVNRSGVDLSELKESFVGRYDELKKFSIKKFKALNNISDEQEYPPGEEPSDDDKDSNVVSKGYAPGFLLVNALEFLLAESNEGALENYLKLSRIPKFKAYAKQLKSFK
ncbi:hypothetical protein V2I68_13790 [Pseudomonas viridiflava]|uniref:Uncharacterized protein n=1 Tax=Pseudomonas viridiflava TaxID=33069 RepID=A0ABU7NAH6_PSEVI|nr:hypothetical protein [Pseudomonas viridiflava]MBD8572374.1 hypothetical protein [Pseudomonas syringae]MEE3936624.1 hypothetical protein [Pseudomonas viridiflava]MEE4041379.1 hypothetical protein [Pseudomonas viridiflava]MEE4061619.1 hypothetical protein [Pseudomonas viridiflava]MEE4171024.1 hypothetical protein [Pseudomonas viridiflava]